VVFIDLIRDGDDDDRGKFVMNPLLVDAKIINAAVVVLTLFILHVISSLVIIGIYDYNCS